MNLIGRLFGSESAMEKVVDSGLSAIDKLWYTEEEKAHDARKAKQEMQRIVIDWMDKSKGQNLARRLIALSITAFWLVMKMISTVMSVISVFTNEASTEILLAASDVIYESSRDMTSAMMLILGFYFAAPHMGTIAEVALQRFGKSKPS